MHRELDALAADEAVRAGAVLLDVREPGEFAAGHAPGAILVPLGELPEQLASIPGGVVVCVCRSGTRSALAADALVATGRDAVNLVGGMLAWAAEGLPVEASDGRTGVVA